MRKKIEGKLRSVADYSVQPTVRDDIIDEKDKFHFTLYTKEHFFDCINECFEDGDKIVVLINDKDKFPEVLVNKDKIKEEDLPGIFAEYRKWLKANGNYKKRYG